MKLGAGKLGHKDQHHNGGDQRQADGAVHDANHARVDELINREKNDKKTKITLSKGDGVCSQRTVKSALKKWHF